MKKIFSLVIALMAVMAINATDYYIVGSGSQGWSQNKAENKFVADANGVLTVTVEQLYGDVKVTEDGNWHPQWGKTGDANLVLGTPYTLTKCDDSQGESDAPNLPVELPEGMRYKNAVLTLDASNPQALVLTLVSAELYDPSAAPTVYCLVGGCTDNWSTSAAIEFADVNGVLTANVPDLNGTFKIIKNHEWGWEAAAPAGAKLNFNEPFTCTTSGGSNIGFANPFAGYLNAVVTLDVTNADAPVIKVVGGTFNVPVNDWFIAGSKTGWSCGDDQKMTKIDDNHYEFLAAEFEKDFKVVFGNWLVEYGVAKDDSISKWAINTPMELATPCNNIYAANDQVYIDVTITVTVNYETAAVSVLLADANYTAVENVATEQKAVKFIEDGQIVIVKDGVRYNVLGAKL